MVRDKYAVRLAPEQREELQRLIRVGKRPARVTARARILLKSDDGWPLVAPGDKGLAFFPAVISFARAWPSSPL